MYTPLPPPLLLCCSVVASLPFSLNEGGLLTLARQWSRGGRRRQEEKKKRGGGGRKGCGSCWMEGKTKGLGATKLELTEERSACQRWLFSGQYLCLLLSSPLFLLFTWQEARSNYHALRRPVGKMWQAKSKEKSLWGILGRMVKTGEVGIYSSQMEGP